MYGDVVAHAHTDNLRTRADLTPDRRGHLFLRMVRGRIVVTGLGICCPMGIGVSRVWRRLLDGRSGITSVPNTPEFDQIPSRVAGFVPRGTNPGEFREGDWVSGPERRSISLSSRFALCAASEALDDAGWLPSEEEARCRTGVSIGSCMQTLADIHAAGELLSRNLYRKITPYFIPLTLTNMPAGHVSMRFGLRGPNHSVSTACAAGTHAVGDAAAMIARGACDVMVAGGTEACIDHITMAGFCRPFSLSTKYNDSPHLASRPFDSGRDGFVISEGAGLLVLEDLEHAKSRGAEIYAEILGYGLSGDAYHITKPSGTGAVRAMQSALIDAGLSPEAVGHINAHATSTPIGDASENRAVKDLFGTHASNLLISAPKSSVGHMLGACGAVEAVFTVLAVKDSVVPPTINISSLEPEFDLNYAPNAAVKWESEGKRRVALTNSFGFGGTNACLCVAQFVD